MNQSKEQILCNYKYLLIITRTFIPFILLIVPFVYIYILTWLNLYFDIVLAITGHGFLEYNEAARINPIFGIDLEPYLNVILFLAFYASIIIINLIYYVLLLLYRRLFLKKMVHSKTYIIKILISKQLFLYILYAICIYIDIMYSM
jgi:hypothetical protein